MGITRIIRATATSVVAVVIMATAVQAMSFGAWTSAVSAESIPFTSTSLNTGALEGCAFVSQRDDILYFASNRAGGAGGMDIWYSQRGESGAWGSPVNFTAVNTAANELCPSAHRNGRTFLFVSSRAGGCGGDDIYVTRLHATRGWAAPGVNTASNDARPNLRRDGLEIFFDSDRATGIGGIDLWTSTRASATDPWSSPTNMGSAVNSTLNELRASLSWDGTTLYFGSTRAGGEGSQDLYVTTRTN